MNSTQNWGNILSEFEHYYPIQQSSDSYHWQMGEPLTHFSCFLVVSFSSYLLTNKNINHRFMSELHTQNWLLNLYQHGTVSFPQLNFTGWNLISVAIHIDFTIFLFTRLCFKEWNAFRKFTLQSVNNKMASIYICQCWIDKLTFRFILLRSGDPCFYKPSFFCIVLGPVNCRDDCNY